MNCDCVSAVRLNLLLSLLDDCVGRTDALRNSLMIAFFILEIIVAKPFTTSSILNKHLPAMFLLHDFWYDFINVAHIHECERNKEICLLKKSFY